MKNQKELIEVNSEVVKLIEQNLKSKISVFNDKDVNLDVSVSGLNMYIQIDINKTFGTKMSINYSNVSLYRKEDEMKLDFRGIGGIGNIELDKKNHIKAYIVQGQLMENFKGIESLIENVKKSNEYLKLKSILNS